jgi:hypothetical protein
VSTIVSEEHTRTVSIFASTFEIEAVYSSEIWMPTYQAIKQCLFRIVGCLTTLLLLRLYSFDDSPASRRRRRKGSPVPGGITGPSGDMNTEALSKRLGIGCKADDLAL